MLVVPLLTATEFADTQASACGQNFAAAPAASWPDDAELLALGVAHDDVVSATVMVVLGQDRCASSGRQRLLP